MSRKFIPAVSAAWALSLDYAHSADLEEIDLATKERLKNKSAAIAERTTIARTLVMV
ncbi:hypothetical protein [Rhizobium leguminosarum]|uniref:hypothetical protein n=1 Tax=Rhizobium leguminosarum TaxID=384 RepID=UPI0013B82A4A|nr:hypothetical protein [Rhizobium leguminosarum]MBY5324425.1 hypothetical protein [Rhizobium leguminosarum]MBY5386052.1 hypothetical protein [Rhizobium leguminosarum]MCA2436006.1 hypothetical protein [Rhizobium leguminosarum]MDI5929056.1 hypothetical protein [Rhizobium leguminosarum]NEH74028.1 hypothetical protein [Rhizobium leguminosarum]